MAWRVDGVTLLSLVLSDTARCTSRRRCSGQRTAECLPSASPARGNQRLPPASPPPASRAREARWQRGMASCASRPQRPRLGDGDQQGRGWACKACSEPKRAHSFAAGSIARPSGQRNSLLDAVRHGYSGVFTTRLKLQNRARASRRSSSRRLHDARRAWATSGMCGGHPWRAPEPPRQNGNSRRR